MSIENNTERTVVFLNYYSDFQDFLVEKEDFNSSENKYDFVLLSFLFSSEQLHLIPNYKYIDDFFEESDPLVELHQSILWDWFISPEGEDVSEYKGVSFGASVVPSVDILVSNMTRYYLVLEKLMLRGFDSFLLGDQVDSLFLDIIEYIKNHNEINYYKIKPSSKYKMARYEYDFVGRFRRLDLAFKKKGIEHFLFSLYLALISRLKWKKNKVLILNAGKLEDFFERKRKSDFYLYTPLSKFRFFKHGNFYFPLYLSIFSKKIANKIRLNMLVSLREKNYRLPSELLCSSFDKYILHYLPEMMGAFRVTRMLLKIISPKMVIISSDGHEAQLIPGQAASGLSIPTAIIPHGLAGWGYSQYKKGRFKFIDYCFAFGRKDEIDYLDQGVDKEFIKISSFPYFSKYIPYEKYKGIGGYNKALILVPEPAPWPGEKWRRVEEGILDMVRACWNLNIEVIGIKPRNDFYFIEMGYSEESNFYMIDGKGVPILRATRQVDSFCQECDLVIGPPGTAMIEAILSGMDYYMYVQTEYWKKSPSLFEGTPTVVNLLKDQNEIEEALRQRKMFNSDFGINDLVLIDQFLTGDSLEDYFHQRIEEVIEDISKQERVE